MTTSRQLPVVLWRRRWTLLATAVTTFAAAAALTFALPRVYTSEAYLLVTPARAVNSDYEATQLTQILTKTYSELLQAQSMSEAVDRQLGITDSEDAVSVTAVPQSQLLAVSADAASAREAQRIANTTAQVFQERVRGLAAGRQSSGTVSVAEPASLPTGPSRPQPALYLALGALLAALFGAGAALLRDRTDQSIATDSATTELFGLPVIGRLPRGAYRQDRAAALAEAARLLLANLAFTNNGVHPRTVAVVSAHEQEGKSTCALSLGQAGAEVGMRVLVIEADLRRPSLLTKLSIEAPGTGKGFASALLRPDEPLREHALDVPHSTFEILPAGAIPPNPAALLGSGGLSAVDRQAREAFDMTIYDTPPLSAGADASLLAAQVDAIVLVVDATKTRRGAAVQAVEQLRRARGNVVGVVINRSSDAVDGYYYGAQAVRGQQPLPAAREPLLGRAAGADPSDPR